jgi:hypothetical protein
MFGVEGIVDGVSHPKGLYKDLLTGSKTGLPLGR